MPTSRHESRSSSTRSRQNRCRSRRCVAWLGGCIEVEEGWPHPCAVCRLPACLPACMLQVYLEGQQLEVWRDELLRELKTIQAFR